MKNSTMKQKLKEFISNQWMPSSDQDDNSYKIEGRTIALNFMDFITEVKGFLMEKKNIILFPD